MAAGGEQNPAERSSEAGDTYRQPPKPSATLDIYVSHGQWLVRIGDLYESKDVRFKRQCSHQTLKYKLLRGTWALFIPHQGRPVPPK